MHRWTGVGAWTVGAATVLVVAVLLVGGAGVTRAYREPWRGDYHERFEDPRLQLVALALLAPSGHNMQPWRVRPDPRDPAVMDLFVDTARPTPVVDPLARQTMVSQGAFPEYMRVAGSQLGLGVDIDLFPRGLPEEGRLLPSLDERPVARISVTRTSPLDTPGYAALFLPDTNRGPFADRPPTAEELLDLTSAAARASDLPGVGQVRTEVRDTAEDRAAISTLAQRGTEVESELVGAARETAAVFRSNERQKNAQRFGFSVEGQGTTGVAMYLTQGLITLVPQLLDQQSQADRQQESTRVAQAHTPAFLVVRTPGNSRGDQVAAGMAYAAICLRAHTLGLAVQPLSQVLEEYPEMAREYDGAHALLAPDGGTVQMLLRVGVPTQEYPTSMRLGVEDLLAAP